MRRWQGTENAGAVDNRKILRKCFFGFLTPVPTLKMMLLRVTIFIPEPSGIFTPAHRPRHDNCRFVLSIADAATLPAGGQHEAFLSNRNHLCSVWYAVGWTMPGEWKPTTRLSDEDALEGVGIWLPNRLGRCATSTNGRRALQDVRQYVLCRASKQLCTPDLDVRRSHAH